MGIQRYLVRDRPFFWSTNTAYYPYFHPQKFCYTIHRKLAVDILRDAIFLELTYDLRLALVPII